MKGLNPFISLPVRFSSAQPQQLTKPPPPLPANFQYTESESSSDNTGSVSNMGAKTQIKSTC